MTTTRRPLAILMALLSIAAVKLGIRELRDHAPAGSGKVAEELLGQAADQAGGDSDDCECDDQLVDRERSISSETTFSEDRLKTELRLLRRAVRPGEKVRTLQVMLDGNMAVYTQRGSRSHWIETDGDDVQRAPMNDYVSAADVDIDLDDVRAISPRRMLIAAEIEFQPRIWKVDAITLGPNPAQPGELMWTAHWTDPEPRSLYADVNGRGVAERYPGS